MAARHSLFRSDEELESKVSSANNNSDCSSSCNDEDESPEYYPVYESKQIGCKVLLKKKSTALNINKDCESEPCTGRSTTNSHDENNADVRSPTASGKSNPPSRVRYAGSSVPLEQKDTVDDQEKSNKKVSSSPSPGPSDRHVSPSQSPTDGADIPPDNLAAEQAPTPDAEENSTSSQRLFDNFIVPTDAFEPGRRSSLPSSVTEEHVRKQRSPRRRKRRRRSPTGSQSVATRDDEDDTQAADISTQRSADNFHDEQDVSQDGTTMEVATHNVTIGAPVETPVSPPTTPDLSHHDAIPMDIGQTHGTGAWADDIEEGTPPPPDELPPPDEAAC
ncbi:uncharacterized protein LOC124722289 [Schistocerca piceifrons]|uniref:uncharacterized protein LOC124722289 n=1 Tax=Schistocerca piceifrons TaxID=274613 RepID=UPI001F5F9CE4|nr:uncharacterized protein LOC124722289 [Schistocerca piceifrons]